MVLTRENKITQRKPGPSATFSTTNATWSVLGTKPVVGAAKPELWHEQC